MTGHDDRPLYLGIDTGGTYTDAVLFEEGRGVVAKAKALTTRHDLAEGIAGAVDRVMAVAGVRPGAIGLVSMSTTLATNALVEGQGGRVGLVMIGFGQADLERDGLAAALGADPVVFVPGGHDVHGNETRLDLGALEAALPELAGNVLAFAVCGYFSTRNPAHEILAGDLIRRVTGLPVTSSHELSSKLGGPRRALTTLLNARLIGMIERLIIATEGFLARRGIAAPLMVVRGDGALVSAGFARRRPIETILSGPAASLVGAAYLTGLGSAVVADIGGTTTDIAILDAGRPRLDPDGARVGGHRTMVEAVAMRTHGLGGDSQVEFRDGALVLGPRRLMPLSLAAHLHGDAVRDALERQRARQAGRQDGRFALRTGMPDALGGGLAPAQARLYERIGAVPQPLDSLLTATAQVATLDTLVARGLVQIAGLTPSDAAHVRGLQSNWDAQAARLGAELFARRRDGAGRLLAASGEALAARILEALARRSAEIVLETALAEDGLDAAALVAGPLVQRALGGTDGIAGIAIALDRPVVGLGASAPLHYRDVGSRLGCECMVPRDADVANAVGAVVGRVRVSATAHVSQPVEGVFRVATDAGLEDHPSEEDAFRAAAAIVRRKVGELADAAGADQADITVGHDQRSASVEGHRTFLDATVTAVAVGRPRIAGSAARPSGFDPFDRT